MKRRDIFDAIKIEPGFSNLTLPDLVVETRYSSTFTMIIKAGACRSVISGIINLLPDLRPSKIPEKDG